MAKNQKKYITENYLDKKLEEQAQILVSALDGVLVKRLGTAKEELKKDINNVQILIDGYVKAQEEFKQEFVVIKEEVRKIKNILKKKFGVEISAF